MVNEVDKVRFLQFTFRRSAPKIKSFPFDGKREAHFIVKPPPPPNPFINPGRLYVSYQFTVEADVRPVTPGALGASSCDHIGPGRLYATGSANTKRVAHAEDELDGSATALAHKSSKSKH